MAQIVKPNPRGARPLDDRVEVLRCASAEADPCGSQRRSPSGRSGSRDRRLAPPDSHNDSCGVRITEIGRAHTPAARRRLPPPAPPLFFKGSSAGGVRIQPKRT